MLFTKPSPIDHDFPLLFSPPDGSSAGGGPTGDGGTSGSGGGGADGQAPAPPSAFKFTDDAMVDFGDGKPVKWGEAKSRFVPREEHDRYRAGYEKGVDLLIKEAERLDKLHAEKNRPPERKPDDFSDVYEAPVIGGRELKRLVESMHNTTLAPIAQLITQQQTAIKQLTDRLEGVSKTHETLASEHTNRQFEDHLTKHIGGLKEVEGIKGVVPTDHPFVRELASNLWLAYDQRSWTDAEYQQKLTGLLSQAVKFVRTMDRAYTDKMKQESRERFRNSFKRGATPQGNKPWTPRSNHEIAQDFFAADEANERTQRSG